MNIQHEIERSKQYLNSHINVMANYCALERIRMVQHAKMHIQNYAGKGKSDSGLQIFAVDGVRYDG